jgi:hypothetical protein
MTSPSRLKFDWLPPNTQAFAVVMDTIFPDNPAAQIAARQEHLIASRKRLICYKDMALIRLVPQNPSSRFDAYYAFVGAGFVHYAAGDGTDMDIINAATTPDLPEAAEECIRLALLLAHNQDGALVESVDEIFWAGGHRASAVPPIKPLEISAPDRNRRINVTAILQIRGHLHRHRYTLWPDGQLQLNGAELMLASPHLAAPPPFMPFAALQGPQAEEQPTPDATAPNDAAVSFAGTTLQRMAVHEAGHALVALTGLECERVAPVITLMPRTDDNLGFAARASAEQDCLTRTEMEESIRVMLGGRAAEELVFGPENVSGSAGGSAVSDLALATQAILRLLTVFGYSKAGGLLWMEWDTIRNQPMGDDILREARATAERLYQETLARLETNRAALERVVARLIEQQELSAAELSQLVAAV